MADPLELVAQSQKQALALMRDAFEGLMNVSGAAMRAGAAGVTDPAEALGKMIELLTAMGELAATTAVPMQNLLTSQRNLANAMQSFAELQQELGEVVGKIAASHTAVLDALEGLAKPAILAGDAMRAAAPKRRTSTTAKKAPAKKAAPKKR